ncbi:hypothetical protein A8H35_00510 [Burkholderia thailandensis]|nr:hypothetical protein WJ27_06015 [Burkholderia thailandensis]AVR10137.1 hypothetical protein A8H31_22765 [Burkholderia thailandensis]AWY57150.1 hypothetical protein A8H35_00510 [Burkholderia thailandensis]AWY68693.1 hypothetical protein A8H36_27855 [Burkholderia thailandensis]KVG16485.1 hypothetical protein WJ25_22535 [Burkholderia thailandensis]
MTRCAASAPPAPPARAARPRRTRGAVWRVGEGRGKDAVKPASRMPPLARPRTPDDVFDTSSFPLRVFSNDNEVQPPTGDFGLA